MRIKILALLLLISLAVKAEEFDIKLLGEELKKVSAIEIELGFEPRKSFEIESIKLEQDNPVLFKTVDQNHSSIRVFFAKALDLDELILHGNLNRVNYSGNPNVIINTINFIPDFAQVVDASKIASEIKVQKNIELLPFMGISKAELLGPSERVFAEQMFVSISNIETYGFTLAKSIRKPRINGQVAKFLTDEIIAVNLELGEHDPSQGLDIVLELDVDGQTISKTVDRIKFLQ